MASVTVIMPSYNKEKYVSEALESVFMQETSHDYHIIAADDHSTDGTINIIKQYQKKYPEKITLLTSHVNQKLYKNVIRAYAAAKTDYFCVLDPDDYWIDRHKIQKSLDFLEAHKDYTIYITNTVLKHPDGGETLYIPQDSRGLTDFDFNDMLNNKAYFGCTLGSMYRNVIFKNGLPEKMTNLECGSCEQSFRGDTFRNFLHLEKGKAHYTPEADAVYRITDEGIWMGAGVLEHNLLNALIFKNLWLYFDKKYIELLIKSKYSFMQIKSNGGFISALDGVKAEKLPSIVKELCELEKIYQKHEKELSSLEYKELSFKNKIRLAVYNKIYKTLHKKGIV